MPRFVNKQPVEVRDVRAGRWVATQIDCLARPFGCNAKAAKR